jgi:single-strand DNA-binding protein
MDDTTTTFVGRVATPVEGRTLPSGVFRATFRLASSQRRFDQATGQWRDGRTLFITVVAWRKLAEHVALSLQVGDPVMTHGRIFSREYEKDGRPQTFVEMEATAVGPNLTWCTATVSRSARSNPVLEGVVAAVSGADVDGWTECGIGEEPGSEFQRAVDGAEPDDLERGIRVPEAAVGV